MKKFLALLILPVIGCSSSRSFKQISAGRIGCLPSEIEISQKDKSKTGETWVATCKGRQYVCSSQFTEEGVKNDINCAAKQR